MVEPGLLNEDPSNDNGDNRKCSSAVDCKVEETNSVGYIEITINNNTKQVTDNSPICGITPLFAISVNHLIDELPAFR